MFVKFLPKHFWAAASFGLAACAAPCANAQEVAKPDVSETIISPNPNPSEFGDAILLSADAIGTSTADNSVEATGNVQAFNLGRRLRADRLKYDRTTGIISANGNVLMIDPDGTNSYAESLVVDDRLATGVINGFSSRLANGGVIAATSILRRSDNRNSLNHVIYTACPICVDKRPTWELRAKSATQNLATNIISYRDVVFEIKGVPVLYLPVFTHSDPTFGRQTGFLQPKPGRSSRIGVYWEQPFVYIIDDYSDLIVSPMISQFVNPLLSAQYRRNFFSGNLKLAGSVTKERRFGGRHVFYGAEDWRGHVFGEGRFAINSEWDWGFGVETASDDLYLERYSIGGQSLQRGILRTNDTRLMSQIYVEGSDENYFVRGYAASFQDLTIGERRKNTPHIAPAIEAHRNWKIGPWNGTLSASGSAIYLDRNNGRQDSGRISGGLNWRAQTIIGNGLVVAPLVSVRSDAYSYTNQRLAAGVAIGSRQLTRTLGTVSLDLKWPLVRQMDNLNLMIIPRVNLAASSKADLSNQISIEDSNGYDNNFSSYFNQTPSSNYDIWDSGNRATIGVNVIANSGNSSFDWFVGKQYRDNSNPFLDRLTNLDREDGDWVSNLTINVNANLSFDGNIRMDAITGELVRAELAARLSYAGAGLSFRYHEMPLRIGGTERANRELVTRASYRFGEKTRIFADNWYDFRTNSNLRSRIGGGFGDDCTEVLVYYEETNTTNRFITPSSGFKIQIAFKTIGLINEEPFE
ncbi:MAG: hypothetical protein FD163_1131 [Hyphomonadaceae bacterium]|nr:MAG: hypothetical protein FD163_1131 [Hyphomonadaceae bacterium]